MTSHEAVGEHLVVEASISTRDSDLIMLLFSCSMIIHVGLDNPEERAKLLAMEGKWVRISDIGGKIEIEVVKRSKP